MDSWRWIKIYSIKNYTTFILLFIFSYQINIFSKEIVTLEPLSSIISEFKVNTKLDKQENEEFNDFISDSLSLGNELFVKKSSSNNPVLTNWMENNRKILGDNPTVNYKSFFLTENSEYSITGSLENLEFVTFQLYSLINNENVPTKFISSKEFQHNDDDFELIVSSKKHVDKDTLLTVSKDYILIIREFYKDDVIKDKYKNSIQVKKISDYQNYSKSYDKKIEVKKAENFIQGILIATFNLYEQLKGSPTSEVDKKYKSALFPTEGNYYEGESIDLNDDEAYEINVYNLPKNLDYIWTFYNIFSRTPNYQKYKVYLNNHNTDYTSKYNYKFYLSKHKISNLKNSLETGGYSRGILSLRIYNKNIPEDFDYDIKKIKINQIKK